MGYTESLLATNEKIVYRTKQHWMAPIFGTLMGVAILVGGVVLFILQLAMPSDGFIGVLRTLAFWASLALMVVGVVWVGYSYIRWWVEDYIVTNQKVVKVAGLLNKRASGAALEKINDIVMEQGPLGRMLNYGTLAVMTASDTADLTYQTMRSPADFRRSILDQKMEFEQQDARQISEAVHAAAQTAQAPVSASAPDPAASAVSASDVTGSIARLAELRDQGAITPEEYEAKKAELLARL